MNESDQIASLELQLTTALRDRDAWKARSAQLEVRLAAANQAASGLVALLQPLPELDPAGGYQ